MAEPADRRVSERFPVNADTSCAFAGVVTDLGPVKIQNISMEGVGLLLAGKVEKGAVLAITLANATKTFAKTVLVRVAHTTPQRGSCLIGGTFEAPLTYQEFTTLVM